MDRPANVSFCVLTDRQPSCCYLVSFCFFASNSARLISCIASVIAEPSFNCLNCAGVAWPQVIDLAGIGRDESVQLVEFFAVRQLLGEHDLADLLFNGHGSSSELSLPQAS